MKFRNRPDILISLIAVKAHFELLTFITKQKIRADFHPCVRIVESGLISAGLPCYRVEVEIRCRFTRRFELQIYNSQEFYLHKFVLILRFY